MEDFGGKGRNIWDYHQKRAIIVDLNKIAPF